MFLTHFVLKPPGGDHIGESINNRIKYHALTHGLQLAPEKRCTEVVARGNSEMIVKRVRGESDINQPEFRPLRNRAQKLADGFEQFEIPQSPRKNRGADELVERSSSD